MELTKNRDKLNFWPFAIVGSIILVVIACGITVKIALQNPVELDDGFFLSNYHKVDENINDLLTKQAIFKEKFEISFLTKELAMNKPSTVLLNITSIKELKNIENAKIELLLTRPDSNSSNQVLNSFKFENGEYLFGPIVLDKPGRWQVLAKIKIDKDEGFYKHEILAIP